MTDKLVQSGLAEILSRLKSQGFEGVDSIWEPGQKLVREIKQKSTIIINGQQSEQVHTSTLAIEYLGIGFSGNDETHGFTISKDNEPIVDVWVRNWKDFLDLSR